MNERIILFFQKTFYITFTTWYRGCAIMEEVFFLRSIVLVHWEAGPLIENWFLDRTLVQFYSILFYKKIQ